MSGNRMEEKLDEIAKDIIQIRIDQASMKVDVAHHIKRSDAIEAQLKPVTKHVLIVNGVLKLIGLVGVILGILKAIGTI